MPLLEEFVMAGKSKLVVLAEHLAKTAKEFYAFEQECEKTERKPTHLDIDKIMENVDKKKARWPVQPKFFILDKHTNCNAGLYAIGEYEVHAGSLTVKYDVLLKQNIVTVSEIENIPNPLPKNVGKPHKGFVGAGILAQDASRVNSASLEKILLFSPRLGSFPLAFVFYYSFNGSGLDFASIEPRFEAYIGK